VIWPGNRPQISILWSGSGKRNFRLPDLAVGLGTLALLYVVARIGAQSFVRFHPPDIIPAVSLDPRYLPNYAARSTLRMFVALICSTIFTLIYGYAAARSKRAERVLIPLLDILQSVPVLGFLSVTVTAFIALFRGSLLGLEAAAIFAIFTGQAWNMTFSFYQSLRTIPGELDEMVSTYRLSRWERFSRLELPSAVIGLVWNGMMSFGGGWFFLAASEAITVLNHNYTLPGIGSYVAAATAARDFRALGWAIVTMTILILAIDQFFWRPLVTLADTYKFELSAGESRRFWVNDLWRAARLPSATVALFHKPWVEIDRRLSALTKARDENTTGESRKNGNRIFNVVVAITTAFLIFLAVRFVLAETGIREVGHAGLLGLFTALRVAFLIAFSTLVWTPIGVAIGFNRKLSQFSQPVVQLLASFPANFLFPFATVFFIRIGLTLNFGSILLMALGAQWYLLFNVIAGAQSVPNDLREMGRSIGLKKLKAWRFLIGPSIFGSWVTGAITASGGAWNASIVSETVTWGNSKLVASGLGSYIAEATEKGDWPRIVLGVGMMSIFVVGANSLIWRRLYALAETRYRIG